MEQFIVEKLEENSKRLSTLKGMITELKKLEDTMHEFEELYSIFFSLSNDVLLIFNSHLEVKYVSPNVERLLGYKPEELVGKTLQQQYILEQNDKDDAIDIATHILAQGNINVSYFTFITKTGEKKISEVSGLPIIRDNHVAGVVAVCKKIRN